MTSNAGPTASARATKDMVGGRPVLRFERRLRHAPEKVWRAVTEPDELAHWFPAKVETELVVGAAMRFVMEEPDLGVDNGEILELDPPKVFVFRWDTDLFRIEIVPDGDGSMLHFSHTMGGGGLWGDEKYAAQHAAGWELCLDAMAARLDGSEPPPDRWFELNEMYVEEWGLATGSLTEDGTIRFERVLVQPIADVWDALTGGSELTVGDSLPNALVPELVAAGNISAVDREAWRIEYPWLFDGQQVGVVSWQLFDQPYGCRMVLTQTGVAGRDGLAELLATWQVHLELLIARLHGVERAWPADRVGHLASSYANQLG